MECSNCTPTVGKIGLIQFAKWKFDDKNFLSGKRMQYNRSGKGNNAK